MGPVFLGLMGSDGLTGAGSGGLAGVVKAVSTSPRSSAVASRVDPDFAISSAIISPHFCSASALSLLGIRSIKLAAQLDVPSFTPPIARDGPSGRATPSCLELNPRAPPNSLEVNSRANPTLPIL